jgi:regulator of RNase E activity RraB
MKQAPQLSSVEMSKVNLFEYGYETDDAEEVKEGDVSVAEVGVVRDKFAVLNVDIAYYVQPMSKR